MPGSILPGRPPSSTTRVYLYQILDTGNLFPVALVLQLLQPERREAPRLPEKQQDRVKENNPTKHLGFQGDLAAAGSLIIGS